MAFRPAEACDHKRFMISHCVAKHTVLPKIHTVLPSKSNEKCHTLSDNLNAKRIHLLFYRAVLSMIGLIKFGSQNTSKRRLI